MKKNQNKENRFAKTISNWTKGEFRGGALPKTPEQILKQIRSGNCVVLEENEEPIAFGAIYPLGVDGNGTSYHELGSVIINPNNRGMGLCYPLYRKLMKLHDQLGGIMFGTTKQRSLLAVGLQHSLGLIRFKDVPPEILEPLCWQAECYQPNGNAACRKQWDQGGECWLRRRFLP